MAEVKAAYIMQPLHMKLKRELKIHTSEPGIKFYSGNLLDGSISDKNEIPFTRHTGFCLETQHYPDSPNQPALPDTILKPGEKYNSSTVYHLSVR